MRTSAFTLAEVLLTLAIIGVVAALTIPTVIIKVQQDQYVVGLKKAYNTLKAVERESVQENGSIENWTWVDTETDFNKYFKPYFDILKDCGTNTSNCMGSSYKYINSNDFSLPKEGSSLSLITSDGIAYRYYYENTDARRGAFFVDVNGAKGPNIYGRDLFVFIAHNTYLGIKPDGANDTNGTPKRSALVDAQCNSRGSGIWCTAKVLAEGGMNY